jgi:hypothetical protein
MTHTRSGLATAPLKRASLSESKTADESDDDEPLATQKPEEFKPSGEDDDDEEEDKTADDDDDEEEEETVEEEAISERPQLVRSQIPTTAETVQNLTDLINYWTDRIFLEPNKSKQHYKNLKYFYGLHPSDQGVDFGRLHCRMLLAEWIVAVTSKSLVSWTREQWMDFNDDIHTALTALSRKDATAEYVFNENMYDQEDEETRRFGGKLAKRLDIVHQLIGIHAALAPIREKLEAAINEGKTPKISSKLLEEVWYVACVDMPSLIAKVTIVLSIDVSAIRITNLTFLLIQALHQK